MPITLKQFIEKYKGKKIDWDKKFSGQCVDLFRFYNHEVLNISQPKGVVGAADFWANYSTDSILKDNFTQIKNSADFKPLEGDVMIWNKRAGGGFGHIAVVSDNSADLNNFNSFDQNWRALNVSEITKHTYSNVYGVLRPKKSVNNTVDNSMMEIKKSTFERLIDEANEKDSKIKSLEIELQTEKDNQKDYRNNVASFLREMVTILDPNTSIEIADENLVKNLAKKVVSDFSSVQSELAKKEKQWVTTEKSLEEENLTLEKQVESLKQELEDMRNKHALELERLEKRIEQVSTDVEKNKEAKAENKSFGDWILGLISIFKGK